MSRGNGAAPAKPKRKEWSIAAVRDALRALAGSEVACATLLPAGTSDARAVLRFRDGSAIVLTGKRAVALPRDQVRPVSRALGALGRPL